MIAIIALLTLVVYEPDEKTFDIDIYDYTEERTIDVVCPEGVSDSDCSEPRPRKVEEISFEDIKNCAENEFDFI